MVEIFIRRGELMPSDETIEQHQKKRAEEIADVDEDRNGPNGLFKGMFPANKRELIFDDGDGVYRCPRCLTEHEGGPMCANCRLPVEVSYDISDIDEDFDPDDMENLEAEMDEYNAANVAALWPMQHHHHHMHSLGLGLPHFHHHYHSHEHGSDDDSESGSDLDRDIDEEDEDEGSLRDFVVDDNGEEVAEVPGRASVTIGQRRPINISDDDSDEGGAISNRRRRRLHPPVIRLSSSPTGNSAISVSSASVVSDDALLQQAGWSPLEPESENEADVPGDYQHHNYDSGSDEEDSDGSDTETIGNGESDSDSDDDDDDAETPRHDFLVYGGATSDDEEEDGESEVGAGMDRDGDTEMSVSPTGDRFRTFSVDSDNYEYEVDLREPQSRDASQIPETYGYDARGSSRSVSVDTNQNGYEAQELGEVNEFHDMDDNSSNSSIAPLSRRRQGQYAGQPQIWQTYDSRIRMLFAEHQEARGTGVLHNNLSQLDPQLRISSVAETASRMPRMTAYRSPTLRRYDPIRRSMFAARIIPSSNRSHRSHSQYHQRD